MRNSKIFLLILLITIASAQNGAKYLIITHDNFYNAILPLAQWKHQKGLPTKVVRLSEINATPESLARIKNYIVNAYNSWNPQPAYVLLVGSGEFIRADQNQFDDYYANMSGNYLMEITVGRLPCNSISQCSIMVAKTIGYEKTPYLIDTFWFRKGSGVIREDILPSDTIYWQNMRYIFGLWQNAGFIQIDSFSRLNGDSARHVEQAITDGRAFVVFRGQGVVNWWDPFAINPELMNNGYKLPIVVSGTCATICLEPTMSYLGEAMLRSGTINNPKGAVAFFGTTNSTSGTGIGILRGTVVTSFFKSIFVENQYRLGDAVKRAKFLIDSIRPSGYTSTRYREWNLLGDPELNLWTSVPKPLTVICDSVISTGVQNYTVTVRYGSLPLAGALVCLMQDTLIYQYNYTNSNGQVSFSINPTTIGTMQVTITKQNYHPFQTSVRIRTAAIKQDCSNNRISISNLTIYPNPVGSYLYIRNQRLNRKSLELKLYNIYGKVIKEIKFGSNTDLVVNVADVSAGVYIISITHNGKETFYKIIKSK